MTECLAGTQLGAYCIEALLGGGRAGRSRATLVQPA